MNVVAIVISIVALVASGFSAWGTWEQVRVDRDAITEKLTLRPEVQMYDIETKKYDPILAKGDRAPTPEAEVTRLYVITKVSNLGKGSGLITDAGVRAGDNASLSFESLNCENPDPESTSTVTCPLPLTLKSAETLKIYMSIDAEKVKSLACAGPSSTIQVYVVDSTGSQVSIDTGVLVPEPQTACPEDETT